MDKDLKYTIKILLQCFAIILITAFIVLGLYYLTKIHIIFIVVLIISMPIIYMIDFTIICYLTMEV